MFGEASNMETKGNISVICRVELQLTLYLYFFLLLSSAAEMKISTSRSGSLFCIELLRLLATIMENIL